MSFDRSYGAGDEDVAPSSLQEAMECPMAQFEDLSRCLAAFDQNSTLVMVVEMSQSSWLVAGLVPGVARQPLKKLEPDGAGLLRLVQRWRREAAKARRILDRIVLAYEAGRDGVWLARWLRSPGIESYGIPPTSLPGSPQPPRVR